MTPSLWSTITITPLSSQSSIVCLERSQNSLLTIAIDYGYYSGEDTTTLLSVLTPLFQHIHRWRTLRLSARRHYIRAIVSSLEGVAAPHLEHLQLAQCEMDFSPFDLGPIFDIFSEGLPSLKSLRTFGFIPVTHESFALPSLTNLEVVRALDHPLEWNQFFDFLTAPYNLTQLTISTGRADFLLGVSYPMIELPKLRSLSLTFGSYGFQSTICTVLHAPNLESLEVSWISDWDVFLDSLDSLCKCHNAKFPNVTSLTLRMIGYTPTFEDYRLFGAFPQLMTLILDHVNEVQPLFQALESLWVNESLHGACFAWPHLEKIIIVDSTTVSEEAELVKLMQFRRTKGLPLAVIQN